MYMLHLSCLTYLYKFLLLIFRAHHNHFNLIVPQYLIRLSTRKRWVENCTSNNSDNILAFEKFCCPQMSRVNILFQEIVYVNASFLSTLITYHYILLLGHATTIIFKGSGYKRPAACTYTRKIIIQMLYLPVFCIYDI